MFLDELFGETFEADNTEETNFADNSEEVTFSEDVTEVEESVTEERIATDVPDPVPFAKSGIVNVRRACVHGGPSVSSTIIRTIYFNDKVFAKPNATPIGLWFPVTTEDGTFGFIETSFITWEK